MARVIRRPANSAKPPPSEAEIKAAFGALKIQRVCLDIVTARLGAGWKK